MVRLKSTLGKAMQGFELFQFLYGTIKMKKTLQSQTFVESFNSYMVRLKSDTGITCLRHITFQFLYGTIKIKKLIAINPDTVMFQFLYGTIKI